MAHEIRTRTELKRLFAGPQPGSLNMLELLNSINLILDDEILFTKADLADAEPPARIGAVLLLGETTAGDGNSGIWKRVNTEPAHADKIQSADGQWWEKIEDFSTGTDLVNVGFYDFNYISAEQIAFIRAGNVASQDASVVTAGLQAMHDDMMSRLTSATSAIAVVGHYSGVYAVNNELFSETFAQNLWDISVNGQFIFNMIGARFKATSWPSHKAVRTSGWYAARSVTDAVPMAMFRWEQRTKRQLGPVIRGGMLEGENAVTDPMGQKLRNVNYVDIASLEVANFLNVGRWIDDINNSTIYGTAIRHCGFQPTQAGGNGFTSTTLTASTVAGAGTSTVTTNEAVFIAAHVGKWIMVEDAGEGGTVFCAKVTSVTGTAPSTEVEVDKQCTTNVTGKKLSFAMISGAITANTDQLVLDTEVTIDLVGRYVMVWKAGSKVHTDCDVLVTRVTAQAADNKTLTLATQARDTVSGSPIVIAPSRFIGKCDDQVTAAGTPESGHNNDVQITGELIAFSFDHEWGSSIPSVEQMVLHCQFFGNKLHGTSPDYANFGANGAARWQDACKMSVDEAAQFEWGGWHPSFGKLCVSGARSAIFWPQGTFGGHHIADHTATVYVDPQAAGAGNCRIGMSGFINTPPAKWNLTNQRDVRLGSNGNSDMVYALGPVVSRESLGYPDMPDLHGNNIKLFSDTPIIELYDTNGNRRSRLFVNGNTFRIDRDTTGDGLYDDQGCISVQNADVSFNKDVRLGTGILRTTPGASIAQDTVTTITAPPVSGIFKLRSALAGVGALVYYRADATPIVILQQTGADTNVVTGTTLTGTTGLSSIVTIAINNGAIMIENRKGFTANLSWSFEAG